MSDLKNLHSNCTYQFFSRTYEGGRPMGYRPTQVQ